MNKCIAEIPPGFAKLLERIVFDFLAIEADIKWGLLAAIHASYWMEKYFSAGEMPAQVVQHIIKCIVRE